MSADGANRWMTVSLSTLATTFVGSAALNGLIAMTSAPTGRERMKTMSIEEMKKNYLIEIDELLADIDTLKVNVDIALTDLEKVRTEEDVKFFDNTHDLEDGLKHIQLF